jgi:RHS repeat-associated protein
VIAYFDNTGQPAAHFQYDPFGNLTVDEYSNAAEFPYRFSTKPQDPITGLYYYGYRWYDPGTGRWPSRDPISERGGLNLFGFADNNGVNAWDCLGLHKQDKWYGFNNKQFHKWFHRCWKEEGDPDAEREEVERAYRRWIELGEPGPEAERCYDKDECKREDEKNESEPETGHEPENAPIPDESIPALPPPPKWLLDPPVLPDLPDGAPPIINPPPIIDFPGDRISEEEAKVIRNVVVGTVVVGGCVYLVVVTGGAAAPAIALVPLACGAQ